MTLSDGDAGIWPPIPPAHRRLDRPRSDRAGNAQPALTFLNACRRIALAILMPSLKRPVPAPAPRRSWVSASPARTLPSFSPQKFDDPELGAIVMMPPLVADAQAR